MGNDNFASHLLNDLGTDKAHLIGAAFRKLLSEIEEHCPAGRYLSIVATKLEEAAMFAVKAMAEHPDNHDRPIPQPMPLVNAAPIVSVVAPTGEATTNFGYFGGYFGENRPQLPTAPVSPPKCETCGAEHRTEVCPDAVDAFGNRIHGTEPGPGYTLTVEGDDNPSE